MSGSRFSFLCMSSTFILDNDDDHDDEDDCSFAVIMFVHTIEYRHLIPTPRARLALYLARVLYVPNGVIDGVQTVRAFFSEGALQHLTKLLLNPPDYLLYSWSLTMKATDD